MLTINNLVGFGGAASSESVSLAGLVDATEDIVDPSDAFAGIRLNSNGTVDYMQNTSNSFNVSGVTNWITPTGGTGSGYWVRATVTSGSLSTGTAGSWLAMTSNNAFTVTRTIVGTKAATVTFEIATDSGGVSVVATKTGIIITATVEP